jgi:hypothetical protein
LCSGQLQHDGNFSPHTREVFGSFCDIAKWTNNL